MRGRIVLQGLRSIEIEPHQKAMVWYYAVNGKRVGPVSEANFVQLVADGTISGETLVWHKGLTEWAAWETLAPQTTLPPVETLATAPSFASEQSNDEMAGEAWTTEGFWAGLQANGFTTSVSGCMGRAWQVYKSAFWACLGVTVLGYFILIVAGLIPLVGLLSSFFVSPQITAGLFQYFVERIRGESPGVETIFVGYRRGFGTLAGFGLMQLLFAIVPAVVMAVALGSMGLLEENASPDISGPAAAGGFIAIAFAVLVIIYIYLRIMLVPVIVTDLGASLGDALKLSWRVVGMRFWTTLGLAVILTLMALAGTLALLIGLLFVMPMYPAIFAQLYEDARMSAAGDPPAA